MKKSDTGRIWLKCECSHREPLVNLFFCLFVLFFWWHHFRHTFQLCRYTSDTRAVTGSTVCWAAKEYLMHKANFIRTKKGAQIFKLTSERCSVERTQYKLQSYFEMRTLGLKTAHHGRKSTGGFLWRSIPILQSVMFFIWFAFSHSFCASVHAFLPIF